MLSPVKVYVLAAVVLLAVACGSDDAPDIATSDTPTPAPQGFRIGEAVPFTYYSDTTFSITFLAAIESPIAVDGPYSGEEYWTFTALPDRKFLVLTFKLRNIGIRPLETALLSGVATTDRGFQFPSWSPPSGIHSTEYAPRPSTPEEVQAMPSGTASFVELFPEQESAVDTMVFEIPADQRVVSVGTSYVDRPLVLE
jgi:hypothetical protein